MLGELPGVGTRDHRVRRRATAIVDAGELVVPDRLEAAGRSISPPSTAAVRSTPQFPIFRVIERHAADAVAARRRRAGRSRRARRAAWAGSRPTFADDGQPPVPCHNDLLPANVLFDGDRAWLIDYEYAGMNEAMFDLANLSVNCGLRRRRPTTACSPRYLGELRAGRAGPPRA